MREKMANLPAISTDDGSMVLKNVSWGRYEMPVATVMINGGRSPMPEFTIETKLRDDQLSGQERLFLTKVLEQIQELAKNDPTRSQVYSYDNPLKAQLSAAPSTAPVIAPVNP